MRTSPVYYIAPSAISITPNANQSPRDLAVHVDRGTKIKVCYQPIADLGYNNANYKEWTLRGRNRRLAQSGVPYTIYARLNKTDQTDGYLVFAQQVPDEETGEWTDPYILSPNTSATRAIRLEGADGEKYLWGKIPERQADNGKSDYWWIRLGSVSEPDGEGVCSVDLDTGILGTDQYNTDWYLNPDNLPERPVREIKVERGEWTQSPMVTYSGDGGAAAPDGTLDANDAEALGWTGIEEISIAQWQEIAEPYHCRRLTRDRWLTHRMADYEAGYEDAELYEKLTTPSRGWEEENWVETSRVWHNGQLWECQEEGTLDEPSEESTGWRLLLQGGEDGYSVELTKSSDCVVIDPSGNVVGGYRTVSKDGSQREYYSFRFFTSASVMKGGEYLHLCGALDDDEELGEGNFTIEAVGAGCDLKMEGTTCYITSIWHCNDGDSATPNTSYSENPEEYQMMRAMTEAVAHITLNLEGKTAVTKDYRLQLVHLPTDTVVVESHNEVAAVNWSTKKNAWTNRDDIVIPLTASSGGQPVRFQTVNGATGPDVRLLNKPGWLGDTPGYSVDWADYKDGNGTVVYPASQHMAIEITIPIASIRKTWTESGSDKSIDNSNLLKFNVVTTVDGVEYEKIVPFTLNTTVDKAVYVLAPSVRQVTGTMTGGTWDQQLKTVSNARYRYTANGGECSVVKCSLMAYDENNEMTEITRAQDIHDNLTFLLNGKPSSLAAFNAGLANSVVPASGGIPEHTLYDDLTEIVFAIRLDGNDYEAECVPILRNGAQLSIGDDGNWYIGGVNTEVFAKGTEVTGTFIYYTDPMDDSTPPAYAPPASQRGKPYAPYTRTASPTAVEGKFIHYVSITIFSDSEETYVYSYGTIGTGNTITVIHDRDYYASPKELEQEQLEAIADAKWSESTPADYSAENKHLYSRDTARYYKNGAEQTVTVGGIAYPHTVYTLLSYWGQDGSGVEFAYYRADDDSTAKKPTADVLNERHAGTAKDPVIGDWNGSDEGWYDDNPGFTTQGQVMYQSVNKYSNGQWSRWGDPVIIDRYAQNSVRLDIDNEMDMVATDSTGQITAARTVETVVRLYDGSKEVDISAATLTVAGAPGSAIATQTAAASGKGKKLSWAFKAGQPMAGVYNISIAYTYNGTAYTATFTVSASKGQAVWQLKPSMSSIAFQRTASNALTPASRDVSLKLVKIDGASTTEYSSVQTGVVVCYSTSSMPTSASAGKAWTSGNISVPNTADNLYVALFNAAGTLLDRETVPVVKDGENGANSIRLDIDNEMDMVPTTSKLKITEDRTVATTARLYDGGQEVDISTATLTVTGEPFAGNNSADGKGQKLSWTFREGQAMAPSYNIILISYKYKGTTYSAKFTVTASKGQAVVQLKPSQSSIVFKRNSDNTLSSADSTLTLDIVKLDKGSTEAKAATSKNLTELGLTVCYSKSAMPGSKTAGTAWPEANSLPAASTDKEIYIALFDTASGTLLDRETVPVVKDGENGKNADVPMQAFQWNQSATNAPSPLPSGANLGAWKQSAPSRPGDGYFLWMTQTIKHTAKDGTVTYDQWSAAVRISGDTGTAGEDASDTEWIYQRNNTGSTPVTPANPADRTIDDYVPSGWTDSPQSIDYYNQYEYASFRQKPKGKNQTWGNFSAPVLWSHWGTNGMDGDGVEYVFARTATATPPKVSNNNNYTSGGKTYSYTDDEFLPAVTGAKTMSGTSVTDQTRATDDPQGVSDKLPYEWVAKRTKGAPDAQTGKRSWEMFQTGDMQLWAKWGADGENGISGPYLKGHATYWQLSGSGTSAPTTWVEQRLTPSAKTNEKYLWRKDVWSYDAPERGRNLAKDTGSPQTLASMTMNSGGYQTLDPYPLRTAFNALGLTVGKPVTVSFDWSVTNAPSGATARVGVNAAPLWEFYGIQLRFSAGSSSGHATMTRTFTSADIANVNSCAAGRVRFRFDGAAGMTFTVSNLKMEIGAEPSDWCIAPEDLDREEVSVWSVYGDMPDVKVGANGNWYVDGEDTGRQAEGKDGTGVEIKGVVANKTKLYIEGGSGYAVPMNDDGTDGTTTKASVGDCYIVNINRHLYIWTGTTWRDLGEFKGKDGESSYMHMAWADNITFKSDGKTYDTCTGFTNVYDGLEHDWIGFCTDNNKADPGASQWKSYKWNYQKGKDGDGYEYVYIRTKKEVKPQISEAYQDSNGHSATNDEYLPSADNGQAIGAPKNSITNRYEFTDDPQGVSEQYPFEYESVRKRVNGAWGKFSSPALHHRYGVDGRSVHIIRTTTQNNNTLAYFQNLCNESRSNWITYYNGERAGDIGIVNVTITDLGNTPGYIMGDIVSVLEKSVGEISSVSMINMRLFYGVPGEDGDNREWIYSYATTGYDGATGQVSPNGTAAGSDTNRNQPDWVPNGWSDNPRGVSNTNKTEYASWRDITGSGGSKTYGAFQKPVVWSHYGEKGNDGDGMQYVFKRYTTEQTNPSAPAKPAAPNSSGEWIPSGWTDDPTGVDATYKFEYVSTIKCVNGVWGSFSKPALWAKYAEDGEPGDPGEPGGQGPQGMYEVKQYARSSFKTTTGVNIAPQDCSNDSVWKDSPPLPEKTKPYIWQRTYLHDPANPPQGVTWSYVRLTGDDGAAAAAGKNGLWYAYAGVWDTDVSSVTNTATQGWYVMYGGKWYMNVMDADKANTNTPGGTGWEEMRAEFKYYIARAYFGDYAHLGSFIINGDWMISQYGTLRDYQGALRSIGYNNYTSILNGKVPYQWFSPSDPLAGSNPAQGSFKFAPSFAVDGKTGKVYMNDAYVKGVIYATSGEFTGKVTATSGSFKGSITVEDTTGNQITLTSNGLEGRWGNDGIRLNSNGLQRYDKNSGDWVPFFAKRRVRFLYSSTEQLNNTDDLLIYAYSGNNGIVTLPGNPNNGDTITIRMLLGKSAYLHLGNTSHRLYTDKEFTSTAINNNAYGIDENHRYEFVFWNNVWYVNKYGL